MKITITKNIGSYFHPVEEFQEVPVLENFSSCGLTFAIHRDLVNDKKFVCSEVSTGYALGSSDCVAGNGNIIPADRKGFVDYCKKVIPITEWLPSQVAKILTKRRPAHD